MNVDLCLADEARKKLEEGINLVGNAVAATLGPRGRNVVIHSERGAIVTKDGVTVAKSITSVEDPYIDLGVQLCKSVSMKTNEIAGDGTTTATVLARAIVNDGLKYVAAGGNPLSLKRGIDKGLATALDLISRQAREVTDRKEVEYVATISGNDSEVGSVVAEAIEAVGTDGIITLEESLGRESYFKMVNGISYNSGYVDPYLINDASKNVADYKDVLILMIDGRLEDFVAFTKVLEKLGKKPLLIIAEGYSQDFIATLRINKVRGQFPWVAIKTPGFADQKKEYIHDICVKVGGIVYSEASGHKYELVDMSFAGFAKRVVVTKDTVTIIEGRTNEDALNDRVTLLKNLLEDEASEYNRAKLNERLGKLNDGVGIIKMGASTDIELKEKKDRFEDALNATRAAIEEGIVLGGGSCLLRVSQELLEHTQVDSKDPDEAKGLQILISAMASPFRQICENGNFSPDVYANKVLEAEHNLGFDAKYGEICDLYERGVVDPCKVTKAALTNAVSIASLVLTTEVLIAPAIDKSEKFIMAGDY